MHCVNMELTPSMSSLPKRRGRERDRDGEIEKAVKELVRMSEKEAE